MYRSPGRFDIKVTSGVDWFDLEGAIEYGEVSASLPEILISREGKRLLFLTSYPVRRILTRDMERRVR